MTINYSARANWSVISPAEMGWTGRYDPRSHPDMLEQIEFTSKSGVTFRMTTHKLWAPILLEALRILDPHIQGGFDDAPDKGSYNPGSLLQKGGPSMHAVGMAADLEWQQNPMYASPRPTGPHTLPPNTDYLLRHLGIGWGGLWSDLKDWMHIENHLDVADTISLGAELKRRPAPSSNLLEEIVALDRNSTDYKNLCADIAAAVGRTPIAYDPSNPKKTMRRDTLLLSIYNRAKDTLVAVKTHAAPPAPAAPAKKKV